MYDEMLKRIGRRWHVQTVKIASGPKCWASKASPSAICRTMQSTRAMTPRTFIMTTGWLDSMSLDFDENLQDLQGGPLNNWIIRLVGDCLNSRTQTPLSLTCLLISLFALEILRKTHTKKTFWPFTCIQVKAALPRLLTYLKCYISCVNILWR